ncbi:spore germination protein [Alkalihalophilus lindianensis]|uniref:Spore germination protein n=1 Tax=Alkalihalophilus lindianensis TaxID=1630542 RepID=A0ABU3X5Q3_9BACI|nr:spore germination protein [Alkalihalophilus lindianensis]MDV2683231.1 spore germination protein [Alkalihalophilus lindianensis]
MKRLTRLKLEKGQKSEANANSPQQSSSKKTSNLLIKNQDFIENTFKDAGDLQKRNFKIEDKKATLYYLSSITDFEKVERMLGSAFDSQRSLSNMIDHAATFVPTNSQNKVVEGLLEGRSVLLIDEFEMIFLLDTLSVIKRDTSEPMNEKVVRGSHEGFVEDLGTNVHLIRRRISSQSLAIHYYKVGTDTNTSVAVLHMKNIANPKIVQEVEKRISSIEMDMTFSPGFIEEFIEDSSFSPFPQVLNTERPDRTMAALMDGQVAIMIEGSPTTIITPITFFAFYQSPDDYNSRFYVGTFYRMIRILSFLIAILLPAIYIAVVGFHFEVIPNDLVLPVKSSVEQIPYPPIIEAIVMELTIELIREAGVRLPSPIGQTIGIVGGLVIGDAIVTAGLVSNIMIIVVALTAIAAFVVPSTEMNTSVRILRFPFMFAAATFGFLGISFAGMILLIHLCKLESFGIPYFSPIAPFKRKDLKDTFLRLPVWLMNLKPTAYMPIKSKQQGYSRRWQKK